MNYLDTKFPYYPNKISAVKPIGYITLKEFIRVVTKPKENVIKLFSDIKKASQKGDLKLKADLKKKLYYFTPCINTDEKGRKYENITSFTGLMQIDFDGISRAEEFRDWFFENVRSCVICGVSPSSFGIKAIIRIPVVKSVEEFKSYFYGVAYYLERYSGFDIAPQNCSLPLFQFYDENAKYREDAIVSNVRGEKINAFKKFEGEIRILENVDEEKKNKIINIFKKKIKNIVNNGHPQVLSASVTLYGFCGAGYLSESEADFYVEEAISKNEYLSKNTYDYIRNGKNMKYVGMASPLYLKEDE